MSSLYGKRKAKAFDHNDDEFSSSVGSIFAKKTASKRPIKEVNDDDDDDDDDDENDDIITKSKKSKLEEVGGQEDDPDYRAQIRAKLQTVKPKNVSLPKSVPISQTSLSTRASRKSLDVDLTSPTKDEGFKEAASLLLKKMTLSKKSLSQSSSKSSSSKSTEIIELDSPSNFVVPKVPQAAKRVLVPSTSNGSSAVMSIDRMQALAGRTASISSSSLSGAFGATGICEKPHRKIKTRLNGTHERKWKVGLDEPFGRVKANFAVAYGVKAAEVRFEFDGSVVRDSDTAEGLDMEDEDILEAKINKALYEKAVKYSDAQLNAQTSTSTTPAVVSSSSSRNGTTSITSAPSANNNNTNANSNKPSIKLCTRLNGKHEWKWKVPIDEGFDKIRSNLALFYGLNSATAITLVFDGNKLQDSDTPQAVEMENDDMIDAKIDASLYDGAIATATARKSSI